MNPEIDSAVPLAVMPHDRTPESSQALTTLCNCGHVLDAHEHYRAGTDCAICGRSGCRKFQPVTR